MGLKMRFLLPRETRAQIVKMITFHIKQKEIKQTNNILSFPSLILARVWHLQYRIEPEMGLAEHQITQPAEV